MDERLAVHAGRRRSAYAEAPVPGRRDSVAEVGRADCLVFVRRAGGEMPWM